MYHSRGGANKSLDCEKGKGQNLPNTDLRLGSMVEEVGDRDGAFCFEGENSLPFSPPGGLKLKGKLGLGLDQSIITDHSFSQSGSHFDSTLSLGSGYGLSFNNIHIPNSTSNIGHPNLNNFQSQMESFAPSMTNNFSSESALHCNALLPASHPFVNFFENEHSDVQDTKNQEECLCNTTPKSIQSTQSNTMGMLQIPRQLMIHPSMEGFDDDFKGTDLKLIMQKELSKSDITTSRILLCKKDAEANLPPLADREGIILNMDDLMLPVTWQFKYRFWANPKSRMYIVDNTGDFVRAHGLLAGDYFIIYRSSASENYVVRGKKGVRPPTYVKVLHCDCINKYNMNQIEKRKSLGHGSSSPTSLPGRFSK